MSAGIVILDRDGVVNAESEAHIKTPEEWRPLPGSLVAMARLSQAGCRVVLATNQSGIARGLFDIATFDAIQHRLDAELARVGGRLDAVFFSPDAPGSGSPLRKPRPGMLLEIADRLHVDLATVPVVGDSARDIEAARAAGALPVLVRTGRGEQTLAGDCDLRGVHVFAELAAFADAWLAGRIHATADGRGAGPVRPVP
jgi:D-glycero-D-manno-heptose 1,7-bisphosphate phosphatase